ncbi:MAG: ExbD/TolR family protein [Burkholderiaceae bacterium]
MAAVSQRGSSRRRTINEINMVPFIDVMLVLLIIFMVTAPLITTGVIDLPSVGQLGKQKPQHVIEVVVGLDEKLKVRVDGKDEESVAAKALASRVKTLQAGDANTPVVISADRNVKYEAVVKAMDSLQRSGVARVGLLLKSTGH